MSIITNVESYIINTDLGNMLVTLSQMDGYDIEDLFHERSLSQARSLQLLNRGKQIDPNAYKAPRTIPSTYANNSEELLK